MEVVGRYASEEEIEVFEVREDTPVWLPTQPEFPQFSVEIRGGVSFLRKVKIFIVTLMRLALSLSFAYILPISAKPKP